MLYEVITRLAAGSLSPDRRSQERTDSAAGAGIRLHAAGFTVRARRGGAPWLVGIAESAPALVRRTVGNAKEHS